MADSKSYEQIIRDINKKYSSEKFTVLRRGVPTMKDRGTLSIGIPSLDFAIYNSFPRGQFVEICGYERSGKTTACFIIAAAYIREEIKKHIEERKGILYVDLEHVLDPEWANKSGYDPNSEEVYTDYFTPVNESAEQILSNVIDLANSGSYGLIIIDSLNKLVGQQVFDDDLTKKEMGGIAKILGDFTNKLQPILAVNKCTCIGIQQGRDNISGYGNPFTTSGGRSWKAACALRLMIKAGSPIDDEGNELKSTAESPAGYMMEFYVMKSKVGKNDRRLGRIPFNYTTGPDVLADTVSIATYFGLIDNSTQGVFKVIDPDTGEVMKYEDGTEVKIRGKKNVKPYFQEHKDVWKKIYDLCYEKLAKKDDPSIVAFEKMLNIDNMNDYFGVNQSEVEE